jgi:transcriptional regulator with XRE-family HTH domain
VAIRADRTLRQMTISEIELAPGGGAIPLRRADALHRQVRHRVERGLWQENLAVDAEIDRTYVSRLERGLENPTVGTLDQLAEALNAGIVEFFVVPSLDDSPLKPLRGGRREELVHELRSTRRHDRRQPR